MSGNPLVIPTTVEGLQGRAISNVAPQNGQVLLFMGGQWVPTTPILGMGVTDGSDAQPGAVGEYVQVFGTGTVVTPPNIYTNLLSITLGPGDWDVWGQSVIGGPTAMQSLRLSLSLQSANMDAAYNANIQDFSSDLLWFGAAVGPRRVLSAAATTVYLVAMTSASAGSNGAQTWLAARRMR